MKKKEFLDTLKSLADTFRKKIEAEVDGFSSNAKNQAERIKKVMADDGFEFFVQTYFPHYVRHPSKSQLHNYLFTRLPEIIKSEESQTDAIAAPRGEAKSTLVTQLFSLWCLVTNRKKFIVIVMDSIDQAYPMLEAIKAELAFNPRLAMDFPQATGGGRIWNAGTIVTANDAKVQVFGSGKKMRGLRHGAHRPDLAVLDDIENDEQVRSPEQRDKLNAWVNKTVLKLGGVGAKYDLVYIGTILHYDSVLNRVLNNPLWRVARFRALLKWPQNMALWDKWEELLRNEGQLVADAFYHTNKLEMDSGAQVSWEARPLLELMKIRARDGHAAFDSELQNDPVNGENAPFTNAISFWVNRLAEWLFFGSVDPSLGKAGKSRDPSAILIGGYNRETGILDVIEALIKKRLPDKIISDVIDLQKQYQCLLWAVETVQFQEFLKDELVKRGNQAGVPIPARGIKPNADKNLRIETLQPHCLNGLIRFNPNQTELLSQLKHFPMADHDDGPDALHMLWMIATTGFCAIEFTEIPKRGRIDGNHGGSDFTDVSRFGGNRGCW